MKPPEDKIEIVGRYAGTLSLIEVGFGSVLHSFRIPFAGNFLALNQGYLLCRASLKARGFQSGGHLAHLISNTAAILKSLAPAGKKLGPMLSLSAQGFLFSAGTAVFGVNPVGLAVGMLLLSTWTFIQPLLTYYLFFGDQLFSAVDYFQKTVPLMHVGLEVLIGAFALLVFVKMAGAVGLALWAWHRQGESRFQDALLARARVQQVRRMQKSSTQSPFLLALKDLTRPLFIISVGLTGTFLYFVESTWSQMIWLSLRPVAIAFLFFYVSRKINFRKWIKGRRGEYARVAERALQEIDSSPN